jgi:hypothetical protein
MSLKRLPIEYRSPVKEMNHGRHIYLVATFHSLRMDMKETCFMTRNDSCSQTTQVFGIVPSLIVNTICGREGIIAYKCTSHSSNIKSIKLYAIQRLFFLVGFDTQNSFKDVEQV